MLIASFPAGPFQTNCYVVAPEAGGECVIIDPGMGATDSVLQVLRAQRLTAVAVLITHGHLDHVCSVTELCERLDVPAYIHPGDRAMLSQSFDDFARLGMADMLSELVGADALIEPGRVIDLVDGEPVELAGLRFTPRHAPGHTPGCTLLEVPYAAAEGIDRVVFSGDVLFAGSVGRTDLAEGDHPIMQRSLREVVLALPDSSAVLSGHGGQTTMARERATNPYLQPGALGAGA
ncbi:MBL fold metallo-hydrolase [Naumannella sp. ID2617S]|nr:MBL fold metallo-hydrolase [Naumannella sp. ID2617S]